MLSETSQKSQTGDQPNMRDRENKGLEKCEIRKNGCEGNALVPQQIFFMKKEEETSMDPLLNIFFFFITEKIC